MSPAIAPAPRRPTTGQVAALSLSYFLLALLAASLRSMPDSVAFVWPGNAIAVAVLARWPKRAFLPSLGSLLGVNLIANAFAELNFVGNLGASAGNVVAIAIGATLVRNWARVDENGVTLASAARALAATCLIASPIGGLIGATAVASSTGAKWDAVFTTWMLGDLSGYSLIIVPGLALGMSDLRAMRQPRIALGLVLQSVALALTAILGWQVVRFPFVLIAVPATWIAVRSGLVRGSVVGFFTIGLLIFTYHYQLWSLPASLGDAGAAALWFPAVAFTLFTVQVGLVADEYRNQARALRASERRVASVLESASAGFALVDFHGSVRLVNARLTELVGQPREAILGGNWREVLPPEDTEEVVSRARQLLVAGSGSFEIERPWPRPNGDVAWILFRASLLSDGDGDGEILFQLDDVSARRVAEDRVRGAFQELSSIIDHIPAMIGYWDADMRNRFANPAYAEWFGLTPDALRGRLLPELLGERRWAHVMPYMESMRRLEPQSFEGSNTDATGKTRFQYATYLPNAVDGVFQGFSLIVADITPVKLVQEALANAKEQAEQASRQKSAFVANMSHEIRTPLNAILGAAWLLERHELPPEQQKYLELVRSAGQSLLGLLNDVLDFSKIEAGKLEVVPAEFDLDVLLATIGSMMVATAGTKPLELIVRVEPDVPRFVVGDMLRIQQILVNLVGNAIKFTAKGDVELSVQWGQAINRKPALTFAVRDTGIGMTPEQQELVFAPFAQADESISRRFGGTGLGLAISRRLVEAMHGRIDISSEPGEGTTFRVTLPLQPGKEVAPPPNETPQAIPLMLVVDDNPAAGRAVCRIAESWGWMTEWAGSAEVAWAEIRKRQARRQSFDLIVLDHEMPGTDGLQFLASLYAEPWTAKWPTVLMERGVDAQIRAIEAPVPATDGVVAKPVSAAALSEVVQGVFAARQGKPAAVQTRQDAASNRILLGVHVMLVEDNLMNQVVARGVLEQAGAKVEVHSSGLTALARLKTGASFDAILMDIQMPEMDGFTASRTIRRDMGLTLPIIALTAGVLPDERARCLDAGMDEFVPKPLDVPQLLAVLAAVTGRTPPLVAPRSRVPTSSLRPEEPVFSPDELLAALGDHAERRQSFLHLVQTFIAQDLAPVEAARAAWNDGRFADAAAQLHALRGAVGTLGAVQFASACRRVEHRLKQHPERVEASHFDTLCEKLARALVAARKWLDELPSQASHAVSTSGSLRTWIRWLKEQDFRAASTWDNVRAELAVALAPTELAAVDAAMAALDFPAVLDVVGRLADG